MEFIPHCNIAVFLKGGKDFCCRAILVWSRYFSKCIFSFDPGQTPERTRYFIDNQLKFKKEHFFKNSFVTGNHCKSTSKGECGSDSTTMDYFLSCLLFAFCPPCVFQKNPARSIFHLCLCALPGLHMAGSLLLSQTSFLTKLETISQPISHRQLCTRSHNSELMVI